MEKIREEREKEYAERMKERIERLREEAERRKHRYEHMFGEVRCLAFLFGNQPLSCVPLGRPDWAPGFSALAHRRITSSGKNQA